MRQAVVLGTGGHCRVVLSLLAAAGHHLVLQIIELGVARPEEYIMGMAVTPSAVGLPALCGRQDVDVFLAIGDNAVRRQWWERVKELGLPLPNLISSNALVDCTATLGEANVVCARAFIGPEARIGANNLINTSAVVDHEVAIADHCHLAPSSTVAGRCQIASLCFIGAGATIIDKVSVASGTTLGAGATLIDNIEQADGMYAGVPARRKVSRL